MKPAKLDLPIIWRGCDWGPVILRWKDNQGNPIPLDNWQPLAESLNVNLNAVISDPANGETILSLPKEYTSVLRLGVENWDWIWQRVDDAYRFPPFLAGKVQIKDPVSGLPGDTLPPLPPPPDAPLAGSATDIAGHSFTANWSVVAGAGGYRIDVSTSSNFTTYVPGFRDKNVGFVNSASVVGLQYGTTYYYRIRAFNAGGPSPNSNVVSVVTAAAPPAPGNDNFANATQISGIEGSITGTTVNATRETNEPAGDNSVWYKWTPNRNDITAYLHLNNNTSRMTLYNGATLLTLHKIADSVSSPPVISFVPSLNTTYRIRVYKDSGVGPFTLSWTYAI